MYIQLKKFSPASYPLHSVLWRQMRSDMELDYIQLKKFSPVSYPLHSAQWMQIRSDMELNEITSS